MIDGINIHDFVPYFYLAVASWNKLTSFFSSAAVSFILDVEPVRITVTCLTGLAYFMLFRDIPTDINIWLFNS